MSILIRTQLRAPLISKIFAQAIIYSIRRTSVLEYSYLGEALMWCCQCHCLVSNVGPRLYVKNYSLFIIRLYWTDSANIRITRKVDCPQECHLFMCTKHPHLAPF